MDGRGVWRNGISLAGAVIVTVSATVFLTVFLLDLFGFHTNPYLGIVFFLIAPAVFAFGLVLIPIGIFFERRRRAAGHTARRHWPRLDLNDPRHRRGAFGVLVLTLVNVVIVSLAAYRGIEFMDSPQFCGEVCHEVMEPEFAAYQDGPHSRISCVQCHIGPGAPFFVKAKLDGVRQVFAVLMDSHSRPIPSPVHNLRPAREVCEQCHWPEKFHGDKIDIKREFADDEAVTESTTTLRIHVGGGSEKLGTATGIHWHMNVANEVHYVATDDKRLVIPYVRVKDRSGAVREFFAEGFKREELPKYEERLMDCMDCHNRPSHRFSPTPERAVDEALAAGELQRSMPFIRREAVAALKAEYADRSTAEREIASRLTNFYRSQTSRQTSQADLERAIMMTQRLYARNVFPRMNVTWGSYPNHIGHMFAPGCFRCHDDNHKTADGQTIKQDCELCHKME